MNKVKTLIAAGAATLAFTSVAMACVPHEQAENNLQLYFGETLQMSGDIENANWSEPLDFHLYANEETGSWTLTSRDSTTTCQVFDGVQYAEPETENGLVAHGVSALGIVRVFADEATGSWNIDVVPTLSTPLQPALTGTGFSEVGVQAPKP